MATTNVTPLHTILKQAVNSRKLTVHANGGVWTATGQRIQRKGGPHLRCGVRGNLLQNGGDGCGFDGIQDNP